MPGQDNEILRQADIATKTISLGDTQTIQKPDTRKHVVLIVHGIRDVAAWGNSISNAFASTANEAVVIGSEPINLIDFALRARKARDLRVEWLRSQVAQHKPDKYRVSIIAHSFGSFVVGELLRKYPEIELERLILCGAILPRQYEWVQVFKRNIEPFHILADCGLRDWWPIIARMMVWCGYDSSGTFGFTQYGVKDRFHDFGHDGFLNGEFATKYWCPWISDGTYVPSDFDEKRPPPSYWQGFCNNYGKLFFGAFVFTLACALLLISILSLGVGAYLYREQIKQSYSSVFNSRIPASSLPERLDASLQPWTTLQEQITVGDSSYEKSRKRLNKWHGYLAEGAQPWLSQTPPPRSMSLAWCKVPISNRDVGDVVRYSCHIQPRYRITELMAFLKSDNGDDGTYSPIYRQQAPTIKGDVCQLDIEYPRASEVLLLLVLVETTDGSDVDGNPASWGFYLQRR